MTSIESTGTHDIEGEYRRLATMIDTGRATEALAVLDAMTSVDNWQHHYLRGSALAELRRAPEAFEELRAALSLTPGNPAPYAKLAHLSIAQREFELANANAQRANALAGETEEMTSTIAVALLELGKLDESRAVTDHLVSKWPHSWRAQCLRGAILKAVGKLDEAAECLKSALAIDPGSTEAAYGLLELVAPDENDPVLARLRSLDREGEIGDRRSRIFLEYALGAAEENLGNYDEAFGHFLRGSTIVRENLAYDEPGVVALLNRIKSTFTADVLRPASPAPSTSAVPIFVLGMPRSGTTLVEQIVASHRDVSGGGETTEFQRAVLRVAHERQAEYPEFIPGLAVGWLERIANLYLNRLAARFPSARHVTDKTPSNYLVLGLIHLLFPNAAIIHCRRDPLDNCVSMFTRLFSEDQPYTYDLAELGRYYKLYADLMDHWRTILPGQAFLDVDYEDLIANPETMTRKIIAHCRLEWDPNCLEFFRTERPVLTASAVQVRRPIYQDSHGRAARFDKHLAPLRAALE